MNDAELINDIVVPENLPQENTQRSCFKISPCIINDCLSGPKNNLFFKNLL